jgi:type IV pilus assembly protein PilA
VREHADGGLCIWSKALLMRENKHIWRRYGFTMIEMMVILAIVGILAMMAVPSYLDRIVRKQIEAALPLADIDKQPIALAWTQTQEFPADNAAAGLPAADKIVSNYVTSLAVRNGSIQITFGNQASSAIMGKVLSLRPAVVEDAPVVPITWVCGNAAPPNKMTVRGENLTSIPNTFLPLDCLARTSAPA